MTTYREQREKQVSSVQLVKESYQNPSQTRSVQQATAYVQHSLRRIEPSQAMGFFSTFKRLGNGNDEETNAVGRAVSLFPSKHAETQFEPNAPRGLHKGVGAKSFSHYSRDKVEIFIG